MTQGSGVVAESGFGIGKRVLFLSKNRSYRGSGIMEIKLDMNLKLKIFLPRITWRFFIYYCIFFFAFWKLFNIASALSLFCKWIYERPQIWTVEKDMKDKKHNCDDLSCLYIFLRSSNIWSFTCIFTFYGKIKNSKRYQLPAGLIAQLQWQSIVSVSQRSWIWIPWSLKVFFLSRLSSFTTA